ncbi:Prephenate dehydratase-domain-containing protein [Mycotypha africana]|uniref:Prephenate dehydratase-domain-containing protein n=1 Tax=Mycotypha africana TaxID=64632 RepID=UPI00230018C6|nr:Prephenate dehydratase-domain-containing protein [Mycotypha africana]KAI8984385.1 Prephenate dehydratase-domain-containing protein [Mycotypha africana]
MADLNALRKKIDSLDSTLVNILNERARVSLDIGAAKKRESPDVVIDDVQVYRPGREKEIYEKLSRINAGPLNDDSLHAIFREIMSASIALQKDVSIAYLGPPGTFSQQAAYKRLGDSVAYIPQKQIDDVFESVEKGQSTYGIVPFENSSFGSVVETLDRFIHTTAQVRAETYLTIHQCLLSNSKLEDITKVYSHSQGIGQTQKWLSTHLPAARRISVQSTAEAAKKAALETGAAAICSEICADIYGLEVVAKNIEDVAANTTRFLIIGTASDSPTKDDHTLISFTVDHRQPGALCDGLKVFKDYGLNLFKIDSRPNGQRLWHYVFFVECSGHYEDEEIKQALKKLEEYCLDIVVLGSFPNQRIE